MAEHAEHTESREKAVPKYFIETPKKPEVPDVITDRVIAVVGGVLALVGVVLLSTGRVCSGLIGLPLGGLLLLMGLSSNYAAEKAYAEKLKEYEREYEKAEPKPSDAQMDEWLQEDRQRIRLEALKKLDLEPSQLIRKDPIEVIGPADAANLAIGKDGVIRFSKYDIVVVFLTDYHLAGYQYTLDMAQGAQIAESTQEYHSKDVVSVATRTEGSGLFVMMVNGE